MALRCEKYASSPGPVTKNIEKQLCIKQEIELLKAVFPGTNLKLSLIL
ncbi:hypothetical protein ES705_17885 [subsurface metagenome]